MASNFFDHFQNIVDQVPGYIAYVDASTLRYEFVNKGYESLFGIPRSRIIGAHVKDIIGETNFHIAEKYIAEVKSGKPATYENVFDTPSGKRWIKVNFSPVFDDDGHVVTIALLNYDITERKLAEKALQNSESQLSHLFDNSPSAIAFAHKGVYLRVNDAYCAMFGYDKNEIIGSSILGVLSPESHDQACAMLKKREEGDKTPLHFETKGMRKNGEVFDLEIESSICTIDGKDYSIAHHRDITARNRVEESLRSSEKRLRFQSEILMNISEGIQLTRASDSTIVFVNPRFETMFGYHHGDLIGKNVRILNAPGDISAETVAVEILKGLEDKNEWHGEVHNVRKDGSTFWCRANVTTYNHPEYGAVWISVHEEITEQKLVEAQLKLAFERLGLATSAARLGIWDWDIEKNKLVWDDRMYCLYGIQRENFNGAYEVWLAGIHPDDRAQSDALSKQAMRGECDYDIEFRVVWPDGSIHYLKALGLVNKDSHGKPVRMTGVNYDITDSKRAAEEHLKYEQQLQQNQKLESLGILAGGIAHDFNNLMGGIFGFIDMASSVSKDEKATRYLSKAMNTIGRARALTGQLLTFAKGGAPVRQIGDLFPFVQETAQFALSGSNVSCNFDVPKDLWVCNFDKNQIGQVIDNLIINAQQAMPLGGTIDLCARNITLAEKEHPFLAKGNYIKLSVKDSGVGIPKDHISRIFDPFFTTKAKGHGLGLATCYSIINRHGGCIDVDSEPGKGSSFHVYLPASMESALSAQMKSTETHSGSGTILVMDDEEVMRETIQDMLETLGYTVVCKENGKDAVDFFTAELNEKRSFSGMIFDLTVPGGMGGKAAIEEIRKTTKDIPVFVASGYADDPVMKNPADHGFTASICKPFRISELTEMLNTYLKVKVRNIL